MSDVRKAVRPPRRHSRKNISTSRDVQVATPHPKKSVAQSFAGDGLKLAMDVDSNLFRQPV